MMTPQLIKDLERYIPADAKEYEYHKQMISLAKRARDPFSRKSFLPGHFTASSFIMSPTKQALLLILHRKFKIWVQPGGHIDAGDVSPVEAARREANEETGLPLDQLQLIDLPNGPIFDIDIHPIPAKAKRNEGPHHHFDLRYLFISDSTDLVPGSDAKDAKWVRLSELDRVASDESVFRAVRKIKKLYY